MIPRDYITEWREEAPWIEDAQVEQDLVISRALVDIFSHDVLRDALAFRGGTALYKLFLKPPARYSEDIDLVQINAEPAGDVMTALRDVLTPWLDDTPRYKTRPGKSPSGDACTVDSMDTGNPQRTGLVRAGRHRRPTRPGLTRGCAREAERD